MTEKHILNTTYQKDNLGFDYSLVSNVSKVSILYTSESVVIKNDSDVKSSLNMELSHSEISAFSVLEDDKKDYRIRLNYLIILLSIFLSIIVEGSFKSFSDPLFGIDFLFGIVIGVLVSSAIPKKSKLVTISFGDNGKSKIQLSFSGAIDEVQLIQKINDSLNE